MRQSIVGQSLVPLSASVALVGVRGDGMVATVSAKKAFAHAASATTHIPP